MDPPPSKKAKLSSDNGIRALQQTVRQALLSNDSICAALLGKLTGYEKELVDAFISILKTCKDFKFCLNSSLRKVITDYFAAVGVSTATERFTELHSILSSTNDEFLSNFAFLLEQLVSSSHVLRHDKLHHVFCKRLPATIQLLWGRNKRAEACRLSKLYTELLLAMRHYREGDVLSKMWREGTLSCEMKTCPYIMALTKLVECQSSSSAEEFIHLSALEELPTNETKELCLRTQMADLILTFLPSFYSVCSHKQLRTFMKFVVLEYFRKNHIPSLICDLSVATASLAEGGTVWDIVLEELIQLLSKLFSSAHYEDDNVLKKLTALQTLVSTEKGNRSEASILPESVGQIFSQGVKHKWKTTKDLGADVKSVALALCDVPLLTFPCSLQTQLMTTLLIISNVSNDGVLLAGIIRVLEFLTRRPEVQHCLRELLAVDAVPVERWLSVLEQVGSISDVWELLAKLACNVTLNYSSETAGSPVDELCPALKYSERKEEDCWSWIKVLRLRVLLATTKWEKLSQRSENEQRDILNKVRNAYFAGVLSNVNWKDNDLVQTYAERWSLLFTCWEALQRGSRLAVMKRLLSDSDLKSLRKWSARIIAGKTNVDGVVVERALAFYLKYLINDIDTTRTVEDLIDWKVLIYLQQKGVHLDAVELQLSVDKVVELLLCAEEVELTAETFAVVEKLLSSRLKDRGSEIVVPLASLFEKAESSLHVLKCAATAIEVFAQTEVERDVLLLCLSTMAVHRIDSTNFNNIRDLQRVLSNTIHYAHSSINNDQCAVFAQFFIKMLKAVQSFVGSKCGTAEQVEELLHGANLLSQMLSQQKTYYSRIVGSILSQVIMNCDKTQIAISKLHSINDKHSSSMMATTLPPAERLQYKRVFKTLKMARKPVI